MIFEGLVAPSQAEQVVEVYLGQVAAKLPGPRRARSGVLAELRSGLLDAVDAHRRSGLIPMEAAAAATGEFGEPGGLARALGPDLVATHARRVALTLLATGPLVGLLWFAAALASHKGMHLAPPLDWSGLGLSAHGGVHALSVIGAVAVCAAIVTVASAATFTVASTGRLTRWGPIPAPPGRRRGYSRLLRGGHGRPEHLCGTRSPTVGRPGGPSALACGGGGTRQREQVRARREGRPQLLGWPRRAGLANAPCAGLLLDVHGLRQRSSRRRRGPGPRRLVVHRCCSQSVVRTFM